MDSGGGYLNNRTPLLLSEVILHQLQTTEVLVAACHRLGKNALAHVLIVVLSDYLARDGFVQLDLVEGGSRSQICQVNHRVAPFGFQAGM